jgi:hypothetical protein
LLLCVKLRSGWKVPPYPSDLSDANGSDALPFVIPTGA